MEQKANASVEQKAFYFAVELQCRAKDDYDCSEGGKKKKNNILLKDKLFYCVGVGGCCLL